MGILHLYCEVYIMAETKTRKQRLETSFNIEEPIRNPLVFIPDDSEANWDTNPLPPPRASYKRDLSDIPDSEAGVTSDWNFVST